MCIPCPICKSPPRKHIKYGYWRTVRWARVLLSREVVPLAGICGRCLREIGHWLNNRPWARGEMAWVGFLQLRMSRTRNRRKGEARRKLELKELRRNQPLACRDCGCSIERKGRRFLCTGCRKKKNARRECSRRDKNRPQYNAEAFLRRDRDREKYNADARARRARKKIRVGATAP